MINILLKTIEINTTYTVNSIIYFIRKLPIFNDLITNDIYKNNTLKKILGLFGIIFSITKSIFFKFLYFLVIYIISYKLFPNNQLLSYIHIYFVLTILGMFINNKLLNTSKKKYISIILLNMDATKYYKLNIIWNIITSTILNSIFLYIFIKVILNSSIIYSIILVIFTLNIRLIGESLNIMFFKKYKYMWYTNTLLYFSILTILLAACLLPYLNVYIPINIIKVITIVTSIFGVISLIYLFKVKDYKLIYKKISSIVDAMNKENEKDYLKQAMVEVKNKDKEIDKRIIEKKKGYDLFNTIFFERHKEILLRSAKKYSVILIIFYIILSYIMITKSNYNKSIAELLHLKLSIFIIVMFFINRGSIITQAMFFNCDHAMLKFNFYREPKVLLGLFKKRLITVVKVNLLPAFIIGIGNIILLFISKNDYSYLTYITTFLFIISLSIFFSVHYLCMYYLQQPYNKDLEIRKVSYSITNLVTCILCYKLSDIVMTSEKLSIFGIIFVIIYVIISLRLVYKLAPRTFKIN